MLSREEQKALNTQFWTTFGRIMKPHHSTTGYKVRWTNYRTGVPDLYFRCHMGKKSAMLSIDIQSSDDGIRELFWEQWLEYKTYFHSLLETEFDWEESTYLQDGRQIARISRTLEGVSIYDQTTWPVAFAFLKSHLLKLDEFWGDVHLTFQELAK